MWCIKTKLTFSNFLFENPLWKLTNKEATILDFLDFDSLEREQNKEELVQSNMITEIRVSLYLDRITNDPP